MGKPRLERYIDGREVGSGEYCIVKDVQPISF